MERQLRNRCVQTSAFVTQFFSTGAGLPEGFFAVGVQAEAGQDLAALVVSERAFIPRRTKVSGSGRQNVRGVSWRIPGRLRCPCDGPRRARIHRIHERDGPGVGDLPKSGTEAAARARANAPPSSLAMWTERIEPRATTQAPTCPSRWKMPTAMMLQPAPCLPARWTRRGLQAPCVCCTAPCERARTAGPAQSPSCAPRPTPGFGDPARPDHAVGAVHSGSAAFQGASRIAPTSLAMTVVPPDRIRRAPSGVVSAPVTRA